jgi:hypothetical protein
VRLPVSPLGRVELRIVAWSVAHCKTAGPIEIVDSRSPIRILGCGRCIPILGACCRQCQREEHIEQEGSEDTEKYQNVSSRFNPHRKIDWMMDIFSYSPRPLYYKRLEFAYRAKNSPQKESQVLRPIAHTLVVKTGFGTNLCAPACPSSGKQCSLNSESKAKPLLLRGLRSSGTQRLTDHRDKMNAIGLRRRACLRCIDSCDSFYSWFEIFFGIWLPAQTGLCCLRFTASLTWLGTCRKTLSDGFRVGKVGR